VGLLVIPGHDRPCRTSDGAGVLLPAFGTTLALAGAELGHPLQANRKVRCVAGVLLSGQGMASAVTRRLA